MAMSLARDGESPAPFFVVAQVSRQWATQFESAAPVTVDEAHALRDHVLQPLRDLIDLLLVGSEWTEALNAVVNAHLSRPQFT